MGSVDRGVEQTASMAVVRHFCPPIARTRRVAMSCTCFIIPPDVLKKLASDRKLSDEVRAAARYTETLSTAMRNVREQALAMTVAASAVAGPLRALAKAAAITVYDCKHHQTLPGALVAKPGTSKDATAKR